MVDIRTRFLGKFAKWEPAIGFAGCDFSSLIKQLLLFDEVIVDSFRLREFPLLINQFGYEPVISLLNSKSIKILCDAVFILHSNHGQVFFYNDSPTVVRMGTFNFAHGRVDRQRMITKEMQAFHQVPALDQNKANNLESAIAFKLTAYEEKAGFPALEQLKIDLINNIPTINIAAAKALTFRLKKLINPNSFSLRIIPTELGRFDAITNIPSVFGISNELTYELIESSLLAIASLNKGIEKMKSFQAVTCMRDSELPLLEKKLSFLTNQINSDLQERRLQRILQIKGFPDLDENTSIQVDLEKLLEIRESRECKEFRTWLWNSDSLTDEELGDQFSGLAQKLSVWAHGNVGKTARWAFSTGIGFIPVVGNAAGAAMGLLDSFLLEKILPQSGPMIFLNRQYPSLFKQ